MRGGEAHLGTTERHAAHLIGFGVTSAPEAVPQFVVFGSEVESHMLAGPGHLCCSYTYFALSPGVFSKNRGTINGIASDPDDVWKISRVGSGRMTTAVQVVKVRLGAAR